MDGRARLTTDMAYVHISLIASRKNAHFFCNESEIFRIETHYQYHFIIIIIIKKQIVILNISECLLSWQDYINRQTLANQEAW